MTDDELVDEARKGSDAAFARLVHRHQAAVRAFLRRILGGGWAEADDVAQEVVLTAWSTLHRLKETTAFRSWLLGIAWRKAQDRIRSVRRGAARDAEWLETAGASPGLAPADRLALAQAMAELTPDVRACVALCLADGWTHAEAAEVLSLPLGTVKSHIARGRTRLFQALGGSNDA